VPMSTSVSGQNTSGAFGAAALGLAAPSELSPRTPSTPIRSPHRRCRCRLLSELPPRTPSTPIRCVYDNSSPIFCPVESMPWILG